MCREKIVVSVDREDVYFHVFGDNRKYFDLDSLLLHHEELSDFIRSNRYSLQRQLYQKKEVLDLIRL